MFSMMLLSWLCQISMLGASSPRKGWTVSRDGCVEAPYWSCIGFYSLRASECSVVQSKPYIELYRLQREDIFAAAVTEVKEETGIDSEFVEVLAFRQSHKSFFQKSDLFFVCMLRPLSFDIQKQEQEIEAAKWMPFEEYAAQPFVQRSELLKYIHDICKAKMDGKYTGFSPVPSTSYSVQKSNLYLNTSTAPRRESKL